MVLKILGTGCPKCKQLEANVRSAVEEYGLDAEVIKVTDINDIMNYGVMMTPAFVVDEEVKSAGKVLNADEIKNFLK